MYKSIIATVNNGFWGVKATIPNAENENSSVYFRSQFEETSETINNLAGDNFLINYEGKKYLVGKGARNCTTDLDKTTSLAHKIFTYTALALLTDVDVADFKIVTTMPLNLYNAENKAKYEKFIETGEDYIVITINGKHKKIRVSKCTVFPEGIPVLYLDDINADRKVAVIDIGGLTALGCIMDSLNLVYDSRFTETLGCMNLYEKVRMVLNSQLMMNIQDWEMNEEIIKNGVKKDRKKSLEIIEKILRSHVADIKQIAQKRNWNIDEIDVVFTGGGSLLLEKYLTEVFNGDLSDDPVWDNCRGLGKVAEIIYEEKHLF